MTVSAEPHLSVKMRERKKRGKSMLARPVWSDGVCKSSSTVRAERPYRRGGHGDRGKTVQYYYLFFFFLFSFFKYIPVNHAHRFKYHLPSFPSRMFFFFPLLFLHWHLVSGLQIRHYLLAVVCVVFLSCLFFVFRSKLSFILSLPITQVGDRTIVTMEASIMAAVNPLALFR